MTYKTYLFDMDGTLLDTLADMAAAVNHILSVHGYPLRTVEEVRYSAGLGGGKVFVVVIQHLHCPLSPGYPARRSRRSRPNSCSSAASGAPRPN